MVFLSIAFISHHYFRFLRQWWTISLIVDGFSLMSILPQQKVVLFHLIHFGCLSGKSAMCLISIVFRWWLTISLIVDVFSLTMIKDDIECDNDDDDTLALTMTMALTARCVVIQEHMDKRKHRQKKKKGRGCPFTITRQRMSILLI